MDYKKSKKIKNKEVKEIKQTKENIKINNENRNFILLIGVILQILIGILLIISSYSEIFQTQGGFELFTLFNLIDYIVLVGIVKLILGILLLIPKTRLIALLFLSAYLGGAISVSLSYLGLSATYAATGFLIVLWIGSILNTRTFTNTILFKLEK